MDQQKSGTFHGHGHHRWADYGMDAPQVKIGSHNHFVTLLRDLVKLVDLQLQMMSLDLRQFWQEAKVSLVVIIFGAVFALGAIPVFLLGTATLFSEALVLPLAWVQFGLGITVVLLAVATILTAVKGLSRAGKSLKRSQDELHRNLEWVREVLHREDE